MHTPSYHQADTLMMCMSHVHMYRSWYTRWYEAVHWPLLIFIASMHILACIGRAIRRAMDARVLMRYADVLTCLGFLHGHTCFQVYVGMCSHIAYVRGCMCIYLYPYIKTHIHVHKCPHQEHAWRTSLCVVCSQL
jgi:hypothetical protein